VRSIVEATDGSFYLAGIPANDILHFDPASGQLERTELAPDSPAKRIFRLLLDAQGMLWASTEGAGLLRADTHATPLTFERVELPGGTPDEYISDLHLDQDGRLWAAGQCGLALLENGKWRRFGSANGLRSDFIAYARSTAKGELLIVYFEPRGFTRARYADGKFEVLEHYDSESHGITDKIYLIGEDAKGRIWVGGGRGVDLLSAAGVEHFGLAEGLLGEDTAGMAFRAEDDGDVWIGAVGGLVRFDSRLHASLPPRVPPATALLSVTLGKHAASPYGPKVEVPPKDASFVARFAGVGYLGEGSLRYRMRLNGLEDDYTISEQREARYVALPPGPYRFEVAAQLGPQGPFGPPAFFQFAVQPAWWQSFWFRTLLALVVGSGIAMLMRWRLTSLHRQNLQLEARVASRTGELSEANQALLDANTQLQEQVATRVAAEVAVQQRNAELEALNDKLAGTQNQLLQSEKMASVGQLAAGVAHEINNPVGYVRSNLGTLKQYLQDIFTLLRAYEPVEKALPADHPELRKMLAIKASIDFDYVVADTTSLLQESREGLERVEKIVKDLKDFSHLDEPEWQLADIHRVLESTLNVVSHELKYKVELVKEYGELPLIRCLPFQLNQVFLNLLINAVQAIDAHGRITIRTGRDLGEVWVQVTDTGKGIDPAVVKRIFEPFFTTKPVGLGTGLGLSVSWSIVQTHGGRIDVASEVGKGTSFTVHLPIGAV
jgi:signal transduction histidine kinase/streptogramin lyase